LGGKKMPKYISCLSKEIRKWGLFERQHCKGFWEIDKGRAGETKTVGKNLQRK
jgi:hypothetical protein